MSHPDPPSCSKCGCELSLEVGIVRCGTLAEDSVDQLYCEPCAPNRGKGYTLADFERWREESAVSRGAYKTGQNPLQRYHRMLQSVVDKFHELGLPTTDDNPAGGSP